MLCLIFPEQTHSQQGKETESCLKCITRISINTTETPKQTKTPFYPHSHPTLKSPVPQCFWNFSVCTLSSQKNRAQNQFHNTHEIQMPTSSFLNRFYLQDLQHFLKPRPNLWDRSHCNLGLWWVWPGDSCSTAVNLWTFGAWSPGSQPPRTSLAYLGRVTNCLEFGQKDDRQYGAPVVLLKGGWDRRKMTVC